MKFLRVTTLAAPRHLFPPNQEPFQGLFQSLLVPSLALPDHQDLPSEFRQCRLRLSVTGGIRGEFLSPKLNVGRRRRCAGTAGMAMPIAAMNKNYRVKLRQDHIWGPGKILTLNPKPES